MQKIPLLKITSYKYMKKPIRANTRCHTQSGTDFFIT